MSVYKNCVKCGLEYVTKPSHAARRIFCSRRCAKLGRISNYFGRKSSLETRLKQRLAKLGNGGPSHWNWKTGKAAKNLRKSDLYKQWRAAVFTRDCFKCVECGLGGSLQAHHILSWANFPTLRFDMDNGETLCLFHHSQTETFPKQFFKVKA